MSICGCPPNYPPCWPYPRPPTCLFAGRMRQVQKAQQGTSAKAKGCGRFPFLMALTSAPVSTKTLGTKDLISTYRLGGLPLGSAWRIYHSPNMLAWTVRWSRWNGFCDGANCKCRSQWISELGISGIPSRRISTLSLEVSVSLPLKCTQEQGPVFLKKKYIEFIHILLSELKEKLALLNKERIINDKI